MTNGEKILKEMNEFHVPEQNAGDGDLPFESLEDYSLDPIGFEEAAAMVNEQVEHFFDLSVKYNHQSADYLEICGFLERGIKYLGSVCMTKTYLNYKKQVFPKLEDLSTHRLYAMVSFNLRKLNRTVSERMAASDQIPAKWLDMQFRFINLTERLKSTESKIYHCLVWGEGDDIDKAEERERMFTEKAFNIHYVKKYVKKPVFRQAPAFPILKSEDRNVNCEVNESSEAPTLTAEDSQAKESEQQTAAVTTSVIELPGPIDTGETSGSEENDDCPFLDNDIPDPGDTPFTLEQLTEFYLRVHPELRNDPERLRYLLFDSSLEEIWSEDEDEDDDDIDIDWDDVNETG